MTPLLSADASSADGATRGGLEGSERQITVVFVDLRGSTTLAEARMPYDVLFILNLFFDQMTQALAATDGHFSQFTGDGLMALYGLDDRTPRRAPRPPFAARARCWCGSKRSTGALKGDLSQPLRIGHRHPFQRSHRRLDGSAGRRRSSAPSATR